MNCSWIEDRDNPSQCQREGEVWSSFAVCEEHKNSYRHKLLSQSRGTAIQSSKVLGVSSFPGLCYVALLPTGAVKIGYSNTEKLLNTRMTSLRREFEGPIVTLKVIEGGFVAEACLHQRFNHLRLPGPGELFSYGREIAEFVEDPSDLGDIQS